MRVPPFRRAGAALLVAALATAMPPASAQSYPVKPIRVILPFSTGGTDLVDRWLGLKLAPAGTSRPIIERLNAESVKIMQSPETRERLAAIGGEPASSTPEQSAEFLCAEHARWGKLIRDTGIKAE